MKISVFFQHGKDAHRGSAKGTLNDSSRSLIWSFWEQIVFLKNFEKVSKISKFGQFWVQAVCLTTRLRKVIGQLQPLLLALRRSLRGFFFGKNSVPKQNNAYLLKNEVFLQIFAILANVDLNLRLKIYKIAIQSSVRTFTYPFVPKRRVSKSQYG